MSFATLSRREKSIKPVFEENSGWNVSRAETRSDLIKLSESLQLKNKY